MIDQFYFVLGLAKIVSSITITKINIYLETGESIINPKNVTGGVVITDL